MSNRDTKTKTGQRIDTTQKPVANFGQGERAFLVQKGSVDPSCILTFPDLLQAKLNSKDSQFGSQQDPVPLVVNSPRGMGIVLERKYDVDQGEHKGRPVNHIALGEAKKAVRVYMTKDGICLLYTSDAADE
mgnify:FL=1